MWNSTYLTINRGEFVKWQWSAPTASSAVYRVEQIDTPASTSPTENGFSSVGGASSSGSFIHEFTSPGTYYYWSGFVDKNGLIALRGVIVVQDGSDVDLALHLTVDGIQG